jgi:FXSXX-COOH protein
MGQDASVPEDALLDVSGIDLRRLDELGDTVLARAVDAVLATADPPSQALAGFNSKLPRRHKQSVRRPAGPVPGIGAAGGDEE